METDVTDVLIRALAAALVLGGFALAWRASGPAALALVAALVLAPVASAQCPRHLGAPVILARIGWSEAGIDVDPRELAAIAAVLRSRAAIIGTDLPGAACAYSRRVFDPARTDRRRWLADLDALGSEPTGWSDSYVVCRGTVCDVRRRPPWSSFRTRWLALVDVARRVLAGDIDHGCEEDPGWWGAPYGGDLERARRMGLRRLDCGGLRNAYYAPLARRGGR